MLDGFELAASAWERAVLPARMDAYDPHCSTCCVSRERSDGRDSQSRRPIRRTRRGSCPATPRRSVPARARGCLAASAQRRCCARSRTPICPTPRVSLSVLTTRGASFFSDLVATSDLGEDRMRQAVGALVATGLVTSDGFSGVRALIAASRGIPPVHDRRTKFAGRWTSLRPSSGTHDAAIDTFARALLRRYGVVFRRMLTRESTPYPGAISTGSTAGSKHEESCAAADSYRACRANSSRCPRPSSG